MQTTKVMVFGLGYIGRMVFEAIQAEKPFRNHDLKLVAAVDVMPESARWAMKRGVPVYSTLQDLLKKHKPDVCIHTTSSSIRMIVAQLQELIEAKIPVVSSSEELFYPWQQNPDIAHVLDELSKKYGVAILGTGVNPGFVMDVLPAAALQAVHTFEHICVERVVNASTRRPTLQKKIGAGLDIPTFQTYVDQGRIGHLGLMESLDFLSSHVGWELTLKKQKITPLVAKKAIRSSVVSIKKGQVCGLRHQAWCEMDGKKVIELDLKISLQTPRSFDRIAIKGNPPITLKIEGGTPGDEAAVAALVRGIPIVLRSRPGIVRRLERISFA